MDIPSTGTNSPRNTIVPDVKMDDKLMRMIGIPFFGIAIPHLSGLYENLSLTSVAYWLGYPYFMLLSAAIWQGNRYLMFRTRKRFTWFDRPIEKLILLVVNNIFYTSPLTVAWLCLWYQLRGYPHPDWEKILIITLINVICVLFVIHIYETLFMMKEQQSEQLTKANLMKAKAEAELSALKNQIDPHFMFNSLNSLSYLIMHEPRKAILFTEHLADIYRYILSQKEQGLVLLEDEVTFMRKYTHLLELRFGEALKVQYNLTHEDVTGFLIPPISAFIAMENAVKHNEVNQQAPLHVCVYMETSALVVTNKIRAKKSIRQASGIGLKNLNERFSILVGQDIHAGAVNGTFTVRLPLIPIHQTPENMQTNEHSYH